MIALYRLFYSLMFMLALPVGLVFSKKLRKYLKTRMEIKDPVDIPRFKKVILIHAASGEAEYAFPVARRLKAEIPDCFIVFSYYSPSYEEKIKADPHVDLALPLPLDFPGAIQSFLNQIQPQLILISRTDLWPEFLHQSHRRNIPICLFSRTQQPKKSFISALIQRWIFKKLSLISAVTEEDVKNLKKILLSKNISLKNTTSVLSLPQVVQHGDTRWDQVFYKTEGLRAQSFLPTPFFVLGSTWPEDLKPMLKAWKPQFGTLVIAPHEINQTQLNQLEKQLIELKLRPLRHSLIKDPLSEIKPYGDVVIIDQLGVLYRSYMGAYGALIGGSYKAKVHSVMEALACQTPVIVGPYYKNNREATTYLDQPLWGAQATVVQTALTPESLQDAIEILYQRYLSLTGDKALASENTKAGALTSQYLETIWKDPIVLETTRSPSQELVSDLVSDLRS